MSRDIGVRVSSDLKNISVALIKCQLLESENWKLKGEPGDDVFEILSKTNGHAGNILELEVLKAHECFYKHAKEYRIFDSTGDYAFKLLDGSLIQIKYLFKDNKLVKQCLTYFQKPYTDAELNFLDCAEGPEDEGGSDKSELGLVWLRFDYDPGKGVELFHPKTHLTISNFKNCRIPVSSPMTAKQFVTMIMLNFYEDKYPAYLESLKKSKFLENFYPESFFKKEKTHFRVHTGG